MMNAHPLQDKVDSMLRRAIVYSIIWLMGIGSFISVVQAVRARKLINESNGEIRGIGKVWWCFIVGGFGVMFWGFVVVKVVLNNLSR